MFYADEDLPDHYTLTDVAALYGWRRVRPVLMFRHFNTIALQIVSGYVHCKCRLMLFVCCVVLFFNLILFIFKLYFKYLRKMCTLI